MPLLDFGTRGLKMYHDLITEQAWLKGSDPLQQAGGSATTWEFTTATYEIQELHRREMLILQTYVREPKYSVKLKTCFFLVSALRYKAKGA